MSHRPTPRRLAAVLALALPALMAQATPTPGDADLPDTTQLVQAFQRTPAWQAATLTRQAEQAGLRQGLAGPQEWTASLSTQRWRQTDGGQPAQWQEWELGLDRSLRLPGKRAAAEALGQARIASADAALQRAWREHARQYLTLWGDWQRECASQRQSEALVALLQRQAQAVATRQRLGDAARIETAQAQAALAQAQAQAEAAAARAVQQRRRLDTLYPGLPTVAQAAPDGAALPPPPAAAAADAGLVALVDAQLAHDADLAQARREAAALRALAAQEQAEARPDPSVGVRMGSSRGGNERMLGVVLSVPFGGPARQAGAEAAALRASAAERQADELARQLQAEAAHRVLARDAAAATHQRQREAAQRLTEVADTLARGFALGEGSLSDLLAARRLAHEQALAAAQAAIELRLAALRLQLETGTLWAWPAADSAPR